jgi:hypothetical protein
LPLRRGLGIIFKLRLIIQKEADFSRVKKTRFSVHFSLLKFRILSPWRLVTGTVVLPLQGFPAKNLWLMRSFYLEYSQNANMHLLGAEVRNPILHPMGTEFRVLHCHRCAFMVAARVLKCDFLNRT